MCGICGIHKFGETPISRDAMDLLVLNNMNRGLEATGVALQQGDGSIVICKNNVTPHEFLSSWEYDDFMKKNLREDTVTILGHTRKATKGNPKVNNNNHPMFAGTTAVVHNGQISTDDWGFKEWKLERKAETDSDIIRAILDDGGFNRISIDRLTRLSGSAAFAAISVKHPGKLLLGRSGNPIELCATNDFLYFSSEKGPLYKALRPVVMTYGVPMREMSPINYRMIGMLNDSAWLFSDQPRDGGRGWASDWLEWHQQMRIAINYSAANYTCHVQYHGNRVKFYDDKPVDVVQCPGCKTYIAVPAAALSELKRYTCKTCKSKLG